jgi:hypothetical protein
VYLISAIVLLFSLLLNVNFLVRIKNQSTSSSIVLSFRNDIYNLSESTFIHIFCWKRYKSLKRAIESLNHRQKAGPELNLIVNLDGGYLLKVLEYVKSIKWDSGNLVIRQRQENIGIPQVNFCSNP